MWDLIRQPWPWWVAGPAIALVYTLLVLFGKSLGISGALRTGCAALGAGRHVSFFDYEWRSEAWNLLFLLGIVIGGWIGVNWLSLPDQGVGISQATEARMTEWGLTSWQVGLAPREIFSWGTLLTPAGLLFVVVGGFLVGFGSRYAGGCTSGHAISGLAGLQVPSLIAVIGFFAGGLAVSHVLLPWFLGGR